jgi:hypothetical protein
MDEARRLAPTASQGQKRILAIDHPLVYRLRHGRWRGATRLEEDAVRFWPRLRGHARKVDDDQDERAPESPALVAGPRLGAR